MVQKYLELAEEGEGLRGTALNEEQLEAALNDPNRLRFISTEVELLSENNKAIDALLSAVISYDHLELAPEIDPIVRRRFGLIKKKPKPMPVVSHRSSISLANVSQFVSSML